MRPLILASASEGRKELFLREFGPDFLCRPMDIPEEQAYHLPVQEMVRVLAEQKAKACAALYPEACVFAFDTMVECGGAVLGKPSGLNEARAMLAALSGKEQSVWTGYAFACGGRLESGADEAVLVLSLSPEEIEAYIHKHPVTKYAGSYALQKTDTKARLLRGSYEVVVGACMARARAFYDTIIP